MIGQAVAHYRITTKLGEGGMGEVYRATDTKLHRDVAIKVLPQSFANDADRMARFTREAQTLAALNHPNIAAIYGVEKNAIVMELVEGDDLKGPLPLETALDYAGQIARALDATHEKGIIHRDLKPANIKVTPQGVIKVLDFGLAKIGDRSSSAVNPMTSPTLTMSSDAGLIIGTAAYMSPEQARGKAIDKRADIWAFGVVLWEMLTGRRLFEGDTVSDVLASVLKHEPDVSVVPASVRPLLSACLEKDSRKRLRDIGDWDRMLVHETRPVQTALSRLPLITAALLTAVALGAAAIWAVSRTNTQPADAPLVTLTAELGQGTVLGPRYPGHLFAISPDGTRLAMTAANPSSPAGMSLAVRNLRASTVAFLPGTDEAHDAFFSPDSKWVAFWSAGRIRKVPVDGGSALAVCELSSSRGGVWTEDGDLILASHAGPLLRLPAEGGKPVPITKLEPGEATHRQPQRMKGSSLLLFTSTSSPTGLADPALHALSLKDGRRKVLQAGALFGRELSTGHVVFQKGSTLYASRFDPAGMQLLGSAVPVIEDVRSATSWGAALSISEQGTVVYARSLLSGRNLYSLTRGGELNRYDLPSHNYSSPELSPDGSRLAFTDGSDIWIANLERRLEFRLTSAAAGGYVWTPDGSRIIVGTTSGLQWIRADGSSRAEKLTSETELVQPASFSPDGKLLLIMARPAASAQGFNLYTVPFTPGSAKVIGDRQPFLDTGYTAGGAVFSPDGRWLAYHSTEDGSSKVYVRPYPGPGARVQVSRGWGQQPRWSRRKNELIFQGGDRTVMVVPYVIRNGAFEPGEPAPWADAGAPDTGTGRHSFDLHPDGSRIVLPRATGEAGLPRRGETHLTFVLNFFDEVRRKVPLP